MTFKPCCVLAAGCIAMAACGSARAIVVGQVDDFSTAAQADDWFGALPSYRSSGGPLGAGDGYLRAMSLGGSGRNAHMALYSIALRWMGDFQGAGVTAVQADFANFSTTPMEMRVVLHLGNTRFTSVSAQALPADGQWHTLVFPIGQSDLTRVLGTDTYPTVITNVVQLMFRHDPGTPSAGGASIAAEMGIDNIRAVPAPGAASLLGLAAAGMMRRSRRR